MALNLKGEALLSYLIERSTIQENGCWTWNGATNNRYGVSGLKNQESRYVHRMAYVASNGGIPYGLVIDHTCRNMLCVNPQHLRAITQQENIQLGLPGHMGRTTCQYGHPLIVTPSDGRRRCRVCQSAAWRRENAS